MEVQNWGLIDYEEALQKQELLVEQIAESNSEGVLVFCTHPPVVTLGRKTQPGDVFDWNGPVREISRGGRATYHGPSQLVVYPILNINLAGHKRPFRDIHWYLRTLENSIIDVLASYGVRSVGKSLQKKSADSFAADETGVWVENQKIASLGIAVRKWITYHGAAINLENDPKAFWGMNPCGFDREVMTNVETVVGYKINRGEFQSKLQDRLLKFL